MHVLVTGGTGFVGTALCRELAERGHEVTALSRSADGTTVPEGVEPYRGDVTDYESIEGAFEGQDAVVNLVALSPLFQPKSGENEHFRIHLGGTENAVRAAEEHGVERFVQQSALGADPDGPTHYLRSKGDAEAVVRDSALDWTILRPSIIFGEAAEIVDFTKLLTTPYVTGLPNGGRIPFQPIWLDDFDSIVAETLDDDAHVGEVYELGGPEVLTLADITRLIYRAEGKSVSILPIPLALAKVGGTVAGPLPLIPFGSDQIAALGVDNTVADNDVTAFGLDPAELRTFGDYLGVA
ncbi:complex I NDUFA9 subunit family protein [Halobacteriales archaeon QS_1_68_20]|nr:MAG: complex I NDUFA9 subunit family protein [Halobacteriales archaeon QS_1_68_20]